MAPTSEAESDPDCPFCEIVALEDSEAREVYRTDQLVAFFPTEPAVLGHMLLIPRAHLPDIWAMDHETARDLASGTLHLAAAIRRAMQPDGLNIIQSNGAAASQTVMHLHIHLVPRFDGDRIGRIWPPESDYSEIAKDNAWSAIRTEARRL